MQNVWLETSPAEPNEERSQEVTGPNAARRTPTTQETADDD